MLSTYNDFVLYSYTFKISSVLKPGGHYWIGINTIVTFWSQIEAQQSFLACCLSNNYNKLLNSHDSSVGEWMNVTARPSPWPGLNFQLWWSISRDLSLADHTLPTCPEPACQKWLNSPSTAPHRHTTWGHWGGRPKSNHGQTMARINKMNRVIFYHITFSSIYHLVYCYLFTPAIFTQYSALTMATRLEEGDNFTFYSFTFSAASI